MHISMDHKESHLYVYSSYTRRYLEESIDIGDIDIDIEILGLRTQELRCQTSDSPFPTCTHRCFKLWVGLGD